MSHSCVRSTSPGTPRVSYTQLCKSESKAELSSSESWPTFPTRVSGMALWNSTHPACTRPHHPTRTRPRVQSPAPEAKQSLDRQGKTDSQSGRRLDSLSTRQPNIVSTVSPACTACQFGEVLMLPSLSPCKQPG